MKQIKLQLQRLNIIQIAVFLLVIGLFLGVLFANLFRNSYFDQMINYQSEVFKDIVMEDIDYTGLFFYILRNNFKEFVIFWLLCVTILGIPYMALKIVSFGFTSGFFISAIAMQYGFKGIILILVYILPHGLLYLPVAVICLYKGYYLCRTIYYDKKNYLGSIFRQLKSYMLLLLLLAILLILGSFLEAYAGSFILKKTLALFT